MFFSALYAWSYSDMIYHKTVDYAFIAINVNKMKVIHIAKLVHLAEYVHLLHVSVISLVQHKNQSTLLLFFI